MFCIFFIFFFFFFKQKTAYEMLSGDWSSDVCSSDLFTDWYPFRLFRVGAAVFFDTGRTWGAAPLAAPGLGLLKDAGFGLRFGNARSGLGNVVHVDLAFPFNGDSSIKRVHFLVQTEQHF